MYKWNISARAENQTEILDLLLRNRGISSEQKSQFLNPPRAINQIKNFPNGFKSSLKKAGELVKHAIKNKTPIIIYGDYDADGICATAVLYKTLAEHLKYEKCFYFIPNRFDHGYGLSTKGIDYCIKTFLQNSEKVLFITVDTGITGVEETAYLKNLGHQIIITDHHQKSDKTPGCDALVWNDQMVGASVSWVFATVLGLRDENYLCYPAIATITDVQPVLGFNRSIVKEGLAQLNKNPPAGIKKVMEFANVADKEIGVYELGFVIGPRLNASGRITDAQHSLDLLLEKDPQKISDLAKSLNDVNSQRQDKTTQMYEAAFSEDLVDKKAKLIFIANEEFHEGVIGLVASKIVQLHSRPAVVVALGKEVSKGSVRSVSGINIIEFLRKFENMFTTLGGHPLAAGFGVKTEKVPELKKVLTELAEKEFDENLFVKSLEIDVEIPPNLINLEMLDILEQMKPFGIGNLEPLFVTRGLTLTQVNFFGKENNHMNLRFVKNGVFYRAVYFGAADLDMKLEPGKNYDLAFFMKKNFYNGSTSVELIIKDLI